MIESLHTTARLRVPVRSFDHFFPTREKMKILAALIGEYTHRELRYLEVFWEDTLLVLPPSPKMIRRIIEILGIAEEGQQKVVICDRIRQEIMELLYATVQQALELIDPNATKYYVFRPENTGGREYQEIHLIRRIAEVLDCQVERHFGLS